MRWVEAVKMWNEERGWSKGSRDVPWSIPRKGTAEHSEITELMSGGGMPKGNKRAGYVGLLVAARGQKKTVGDYDPEARPKKMARSINLEKMSKFSPYMLEHYGSPALKTKMKPMRKQSVLKEIEDTEGKRKLQAKTVRPTLLAHPTKKERRKKQAEAGKQSTLDKHVAAVAAAPENVIEHIPAEPTARKLTIQPQTGYRSYAKTAKEQEAERAAEIKKRREQIKYAEENWKHLTMDEKIDTYFRLEEEGGEIPAVMRKAYENWVKKGRPSASAIKGIKGRLPQDAYNKWLSERSKK